MTTGFLVFLLGSSLFAQASQPAGQPAGPASVTARVTLIMEVDEQHLKVQESWQLEAPGPVPASSLVFPLGSGVRRLELDERTPGFEANESGTVIRATQDLGPDGGGFAGAYLLDRGEPEAPGIFALFGASGRDKAVIERRLPVPVSAGRVILEEVPGLSVQGSTRFEARTRDLNGRLFRIFEFGGLERGHALRIELSGLPSRSLLPRTAAVVVSLSALLWMTWALLRAKRATPAPVLGALSAEARREQLVKALELLEEDRQAGRLDQSKHEKRRKTLIGELAIVLREIELSRGSRSS